MVLLSIDYKILGETIFWTIAITMALPFGMVLECLYSTFYHILGRAIKKLSKYKYTNWIHLPHFIASKRYVNYEKYYAEIKNKKYNSEERFQQLLSENNIIRNLWISSLAGIIFILISLNFSFYNTIHETRILIWLPISIPFMWLANIRLEVLIKDFKSNKHVEELKQQATRKENYGNEIQ